MRNDRVIEVGVLRGDGIGPEVATEGLRVLDHVASKVNLRYRTTDFPFGADHYLATGEVLPDEALEQMKGCDVLYAGAVGDPRVPPRLLEHGLLLRIIQQLDLVLSIRPFRLFHQDLCPLKGYAAGEIDLVIVREGYEGAAGQSSSSIRFDTPDEVAVAPIVFTRRNVERTVRYGFELARRRDRQRRVTVVDQSNGVQVMDIWRRTLEVVRTDFPDIDAEHEVADAFAMRLVKQPEHFDVVVSSLVLGGIYADLGAIIVGGLGVAGSARVNPDASLALFEPIHGSAPKYAGRGVVAPIGAILSVGLMLDHLGEPEGARMILEAVSAVLGDGRIRSLDATSGVGTREQADLVLAAIG